MVVALLLQAIPATGIFMMMLGGPFWSTILINLAFGLMVRDVITGSASRWMLLPPALWFGGYVAAAAVSHFEVGRINDEIASHNIKLHLPFDPARQDLVIGTENASYDHTGYEAALSPERLIRSFGLTRAYSYRQHPVTREETYRKFNLVTSPCYFDRSGRSRALDVNDEGNSKGRPPARARDLCLYSYDEEPELPFVGVSAGREERQRGLVETVTQSLRVRTPDGATAILHAEMAKALTWFPEPFIGCGLNEAHWICDWGFAYEESVHGKGDPFPNGPDDVLAHALGLTKVSIRDRFPATSWEQARD